MSNPDTTRIFNYPEVTTPASDAKILLDSQTVGSKCIDANLFRCDLIDKTITQRGTFEASEDDADGFKKVVVDIPYTDVHVASGPIATFEGEDLPLKSLTASIVPVQDLHGYDSPWVGGAGKNKFDYLQLTNASGWTNTSGTYSGNIYNLYAYAGSGFPTQPTYKANTAYTLSMKVVDTDGTSRFVIEYTDSTTDYVVISSGNVGNYVTVTSNPSKTISKIYFTYNNSGNLSIREIMLEEGTSRTAWTPYSNICPISGWTEEVVTRTGKNLFDIHIDKDTAYTNIILDKPLDQTFTVSAVNNNVAVSEIVWRIGFIYKNNEVYYIGDNGYQRPFPQTIIATESNPIVKIQYRGTTMTSGSYDVQVELGSQPTTYEPYNGQTTTIPFTDSQGQSVEVFGGSVDVVNGGEQQRTLASVDLATVSREYNSGWNCWVIQATSVPNAKIVDSNTTPTNAMSDRFKTVKASGYTSSHESNTIAQNTSGIWFIDNGSTTELSGQLVYELATPTTFYTQPTSIKSLDGVNNVFASTGDVDVEYQTVWVRPTE